MEIIFGMPRGGAPIGSDDWIQSVIRKPEEIPFQWASKYPQLEKALVKHLMETGKDGNGFPKLLEGEYFFKVGVHTLRFTCMYRCHNQVFSGDTIPSYKSVYRRHDGRTVNRRSVKENDMLKFLRSASHNSAIDRLRQAALYPVQIPETPPNKQPWDNFAIV